MRIKVFFSLTQQKGYALEKAKRHKAYREYTRWLQPQKEKKDQKELPPLKWKLSTPKIL